MKQKTKNLPREKERKPKGLNLKKHGLQYLDLGRGERTRNSSKYNVKPQRLGTKRKDYC